MTSSGNQLMSFGSFGNRRVPTTWVTPVSNTEAQADHAADCYGFTHQEMLDNVNLIHMNGRVYDPSLGRFLSVEPVFEFPTNMQSLNPYSYVLNNPLSLTDPTGYSAAAGTSPVDESPARVEVPTIRVGHFGCWAGEAQNPNFLSNGYTGTESSTGAQTKNPKQAGEGEGSPNGTAEQHGKDANISNNKSKNSQNGNIHQSVGIIVDNGVNPSGWAAWG